ncbi:iron ABC transporter permease, partial [Escherichia coli]|nr:iron ABC transporter permease [Escherichia coli]
RYLFSALRSTLKPLHLCSLCIALGVLTPVITLFWLATDADSSQWSGFLTFVLPSALQNTVILLTGVAVMTCVLGVGCAWAVTVWDFPGRK